MGGLGRKLSVVDSTKILSWLHSFYGSLSVKGLPEGQILYRLRLTPDNCGIITEHRIGVHVGWTMIED